MESRAAVREFQEAIEELNVELDRLRQNLQEVCRYLTQVFRVTKVLCSWMENIGGLARHRAQLYAASNAPHYYLGTAGEPPSDPPPESASP